MSLPGTPPAFHRESQAIPLEIFREILPVVPQTYTVFFFTSSEIFPGVPQVYFKEFQNFSMELLQQVSRSSFNSSIEISPGFSHKMLRESLMDTNLMDIYRGSTGFIEKFIKNLSENTSRMFLEISQTFQDIPSLFIRNFNSRFPQNLLRQISGFSPRSPPAFM